MAYIDVESPQYFAFNIWDIASAKAIIDAAAVKKCPIILQTSMKAFALMDLEEMRFFVTTYGNRQKVPVYLHLDHCKEMEMICQALDAGWDSVMIDASERSLEDNIELTNRVTELAHTQGALVEAEVGQISGVEDDITVSEAGVARIQDVEKFLKHTNVDMLAVAIGTAHGQYHGLPNLHYELLRQVGELTSLPLVIHGGSGLSDEMLCKLFSYHNVKKINISTDVKQAYRRGIINCVQDNLLQESGFDPLSVMKQIHDSIFQMVMNKIYIR